MSQSAVRLDAICVTQPATAMVRVVEEAEATHLSDHLSVGELVQEGLVENPFPVHGWL